MSTESARIHTYGCDRHKEDTYEGCYSCDLQDNSELSSRLNARIAELEQQLVGANQTIALFMGPDGEQHIERFAELVKRPDLCEMEPPDISHDLSNGVVCIGCWNELAQRAGKQAVALESMNDRIAELEREKHDLQSALRELLQDTQHVNHNCGDTSDRCPVLRAREVLNELMVK